MGKRKIIILGAGGSASTNYVRSLRMANRDYWIIGADCNKFYLQRAETDERYLIPRADSPDYIAVLNKIIKRTCAEFLHAQNDTEVAVIGEEREKLNTVTFLPEMAVIRICQNKWSSRQFWAGAGIKHPVTHLIYEEEEVEERFNELGKDVWIRDIKGAGGKGSIRIHTVEEAINWIKYNNGWGHYTIAEYLSERSTTFTTIWKDGLLIAGQGRKRIYWELGLAFISGVSGATGGGQIDNDSVVADMAIKAIKAIDPIPHGIYSVDMTYGQDGVPYPTEINIGRFFTTHLFLAKAGLNVANIYTQIGLGEKVYVRKVNSCKPNLVWIRGMDFEPVFTTIEKINAG